jgi:hypothetical protein
MDVLAQQELDVTLEDKPEKSINYFHVGFAPVVRSIVSNAKFDVEKFDGKNNFDM